MVTFSYAPSLDVTVTGRLDEITANPLVTETRLTIVQEPLGVPAKQKSKKERLKWADGAMVNGTAGLWLSPPLHISLGGVDHSSPKPVIVTCPVVDAHPANATRLSTTARTTPVATMTGTAQPREGGVGGRDPGLMPYVGGSGKALPCIEERAEKWSRTHKSWPSTAHSDQLERVGKGEAGCASGAFWSLGSHVAGTVTVRLAIIGVLRQAGGTRDDARAEGDRAGVMAAERCKATRFVDLRASGPRAACSTDDEDAARARREDKL
jgi:hypothetical protein